MITATSRMCSRCRRLLDEGAVVCAHCDKVACPLLGDWPATGRRALTLLTLADAAWLALAQHQTEQAQWELVLLRSFRGRWYGNVLVPQAASPADCYPILTGFVTRWEEAGRPTDLAAVARLRDTLRLGGAR